MALPAVAGWIIDFRTAKFIFASGNNLWISHCVDQCAHGCLFMCHREEEDFKSVPQLRAPFLDDNKCMVEPDDEIADCCIAMDASPPARKLFAGDGVSIYIAGIASAKGYGVISDHRG